MTSGLGSSSLNRLCCSGKQPQTSFVMWSAGGRAAEIIDGKELASSSVVLLWSNCLEKLPSLHGLCLCRVSQSVIDGLGDWDKFAWPDTGNMLSTLCILSSGLSHSWGTRPPTHPWNKLLLDNPGGTTMLHGSSLSFLTAFYLKHFLLVHPDAFYLGTLITKAVTNSTSLKCRRPNFCFTQHWEIKIICHHDFLVNWMFSPQVRDCSRYRNTLSVPHFINWVNMDYKISSEVSGFGSLQTHIRGQWPKATDYYHQKVFCSKPPGRGRKMQVL